MKHCFRVLCAALFLLCAGLQSAGAQVQVVFMGNSITELWAKYHQSSFMGPNNYSGKGISGQVTTQMLQRFQSDVIAQKPKAVVIMAGINDIAQNQGYIAIEQICENIATMGARATEAGIKVIICSVLPASGFGWTSVVAPAPIVRRLNMLLEEMARRNGYVWLEYYSAMVNDIGGMNTQFCTDRVHPLETGYELLEQIVQPYLEDILK